MTIINSHVHLEDINALPATRRALAENGVQRMCVLSYSKHELVNNNLIALEAKLRYPDEIYAFGGLDYSQLPKERKAVRRELAAQVNALRQIGFDGVKMLDLMPPEFIKTPFMRDDSVYEDFFAFLQDTGMPVTMHVAAPDFFWEKGASSLPGCYYSEKLPSREKIYKVLDNILKKFPALKLVLAHFGFLQYKLDELENLLDRHPYLYVDTTPGRCVYRDLSENPRRTKDFFNKYQERILFGSDLQIGPAKPKGAFFSQQDNIDSIKIVRKYLETEEVFPIKIETGYSCDIKGLGLAKTVTDKIYHKNFESLTASTPVAVNKTLYFEEASRLKQYFTEQQQKHRITDDNIFKRFPF
jgi:predicted TIM-barrel fold metal-dependent hydrolase